MPLCDMGAAIQEVIESYEIEIDGKTYPSLFHFNCFVNFILIFKNREIEIYRKTYPNFFLFYISQ